MTVRIVTDSTSDVPRALARDMGITVVPAYVMFGQESYRDRVDIDEDEFYRRLESAPVHPTTSAPTPSDFAAVYKALATDTDEIVSIHISSKLSGVCTSALMGAELAGGDCRVEVLDSGSMGMGLLLTVIAAAEEAQSGCSLEELTGKIHQTVHRIHNLAMADTLKYAVKSGRINSTYGLLGAALQVRVLLGVRDGDVFRWGLTRTRAKAIERLHEFALSFPDARAIALGYATANGDTKALSDRLKIAFPDAQHYLARVGPAIGTYGGPHAMGIAVLEGESGWLSARTASAPKFHFG